MNDHPRRPVLLLVIVLSTAACLLESWPSSAQVPTAASSSASTPPAPVRSQPLAVPTGTFLGGVPTGQLTGDVVKISVVAAISRALEHNLGVLTAEQNVGRAQGARTRILSELLPNVNGRVGETRQTINLAAFGFSGGPGSPFGDIPTIVGPFNVFHARVFLSQSVLDFGALNNARAEAHNVEASRLMYRGARDFVIHVAG